MFDISCVEHDLLEMKANTLYKYGKKVELAEQMFHQKAALKKRLELILYRLEHTVVIRHGWCRKKRQSELTERVRSKLFRTAKAVAKLEELKNKYIEDFKFQREACGLYDHTFVDEIYD